MITWGFVTALTALVVGEFSFYLARILLGIAEAGLFPGVLLYRTYWVPKAVCGRLTAIFLMAAPIASIIAGPVSSLVFRLLPSTPREAKWLTPDDLRFMEGELERDRRESPEPEHGSVWAAFRSKPVLALALAYFGLNAGLYYLNFFLPQVPAAFKDGDAAQFDTIQIERASRRSAMSRSTVDSSRIVRSPGAARAPDRVSTSLGHDGRRRQVMLANGRIVTLATVVVRGHA